MNTTLIPPGASVPQHAYTRVPTSAPEDPYAQELKQSEPIQAYAGSNNTVHQHQHHQQRPGQVRTSFDQFLDEANENPIDAIANTKVGGFFVGIVKYFMRFFGLVLVAVALFLIISIIFLFFFVVVPMLSPIPLYSPGPITLTNLVVFGINFSVGIWVAFNLLFNYIQTMRTSPGYVPEEWIENNHAHEMEEAKHAVGGAHAPGTGRWSKHCNKCKKPKPPRTHHCHICDTCVLRMDHHCPWVNNCVGYKNHRYFVLFLFYLWVACSYLTLLLLGCTFDFIPLHDNRLWYEWQAIVTFVMVLCASLAITMTGFFGWHAYLVLTNQTTIEFQFNKIKAWTVSNNGVVSTNEYDMGFKQNVQQIFGYGGFFSWVAPTLSPPPLNGTDWPTLSSLKI